MIAGVTTSVSSGIEKVAQTSSLLRYSPATPPSKLKVCAAYSEPAHTEVGLPAGALWELIRTGWCLKCEKFVTKAVAFDFR